MKRLLFFLLIFSLLSFATFNETRTIVQISPKSTLCVEGKTNVNRFRCDFDVATINDEVLVSYVVKPEQVLEFSNAKLVLSNNCFDCGNKGMNKDFYELLKSDAYPQIILTLKTLDLKTSKDNMVEASVNIEMAGTDNTYNTQVFVDRGSGYGVSGELNLNISDFDLEPPQKMLGMMLLP